MKIYHTISINDVMLNIPFWFKCFPLTTSQLMYFEESENKVIWLITSCSMFYQYFCIFNWKTLHLHNVRTQHVFDTDTLQPSILKVRCFNVERQDRVKRKAQLLCKRFIVRPGQQNFLLRLSVPVPCSLCSKVRALNNPGMLNSIKYSIDFLRFSYRQKRHPLS